MAKAIYIQERTTGGFSLVELLIVVNIIFILVAIAVPNLLPANGKLRLSGAADVLVERLDRARVDAWRRHSTASVAVVDNFTYNVTMDSNGTGVNTTYSVPLPLDVSFPSGTSTAPITFDQNGRTSARTLQLQSGTDTRTIDITTLGNIGLDTTDLGNTTTSVSTTLAPSSGVAKTSPYTP